MTNFSGLALWTLNSLLNAGGVFAAARVWNLRYTRKFAHLLWLLPAVLLSASLAAYFGSSAVNEELSHLAASISLRNLASNLAAYLILGFIFLSAARMAVKRRMAAIQKKSRASAPAAGGDLNETVQAFLSAADSADLNRLAAIYAQDFLCVRIADAGGQTQLTADQMLSFLRRATAGEAVGHAVPIKDSKIHHSDVFGDSAVVLVTRTKDLGNGWEPLFYTLFWTRQNNRWHLSREFVHQRSAPNWA